MIIKCLADDSDPGIECTTTLGIKNVKLPFIDSNCIQTTRSAKKPIFSSVFDSLKYLIKEEKCKNANSKPI